MTFYNQNSRSKITGDGRTDRPTGQRTRPTNSKRSPTRSVMICQTCSFTRWIIPFFNKRYTHPSFMCILSFCMSWCFNCIFLSPTSISSSHGAPFTNQWYRLELAFALIGISSCLGDYFTILSWFLIQRLCCLLSLSVFFSLSPFNREFNENRSSSIFVLLPLCFYSLSSLALSFFLSLFLALAVQLATCVLMKGHECSTRTKEPRSTFIIVFFFFSFSFFIFSFFSFFCLFYIYFFLFFCFFFILILFSPVHFLFFLSSRLLFFFSLSFLPLLTSFYKFIYIFFLVSS